MNKQLNSFQPGEIWPDTDARPIQAHGGGILFHAGTYYWYGEDKDGETKPGGGCGPRMDFRGISCYSSADLYNWRNEGLVLTVVPDDSAHDLHSSKVVERPKVVFNVRTRKFVMWMHIDTILYKTAMAGVAVANSPTGPFEYIGSVKPEGQDSRDQTLFQDDDGKAYRIYASEANRTTYISLLSDDYLEHSIKFVRIFEDRDMEAQCIFKSKDKYYLIASGCSGWAPNEARSAVSDSIWGPWKELGNPCIGEESALTFHSQGAFVLPLAGKPDMFIFMADRWNPKCLSDSRYVWLPALVDKDRIWIEYLKEWDLSFFNRFKKQ